MVKSHVFSFFYPTYVDNHCLLLSVLAEEILTGIAMDHCYIAQSSRILKVGSVESNRAAPATSEESPSDDLDSTLASMHAEEEPLKDSDQDGSSNDDVSNVIHKTFFIVSSLSKMPVIQFHFKWLVLFYFCIHM